MQKYCNVCESPLPAPIYHSHTDSSLTSLCQLYPGPTQVWFCKKCGHIMGSPLERTAEYYANDYKILLNQDEEDQIYEVVDGVVTYRIAHQLKVLNSKLRLHRDQKILDYGCAKGGMAANLLRQIPGLDFHFFDVSEMYRSYWARMTTPDKCAVNDTPAQWAGRFDVVTSYFSLEHIPEPRLSAEHIASLLKNDGVFYAVVPDTLGNVADFLVVDHVNHFTVNSVIRLLQDVGFNSVEVDSQRHRGALVVIARKEGVSTSPQPIANLYEAVNGLSRFWSDLSMQIAAIENSHSVPAAIYGSGFYGAFIYANLKNPQVVKLFLDQSPYQQGRFLFDVPIVSPDVLPKSVETLYVGLNPKIARQVIASQPGLTRSGLRHIFLDSPQ